MEFKSIDELMKEYREAAEKYPIYGRDSYILGRLEISYKLLYEEYLKLKHKK